MLQGGPGWGATGPFGVVAATPLQHTRNCGKSRDRGVATPLQNTKEYRDHMGYLNQSCSGVKQGGIKGEVKKGKGVREGTRPEGERGGKNKGKGWEERGPKARSKNSDFSTPLI